MPVMTSQPEIAAPATDTAQQELRPSANMPHLDSNKSDLGGRLAHINFSIPQLDSSMSGLGEGLAQLQSAVPQQLTPAQVQLALLMAFQQWPDLANMSPAT